MEEITYHDNKNGRQYDSNGHLTDNWNPHAKYAEDEYVRVFFRVETPSYYDYERASLGFKNPDTREAFYKDAAAALSEVGWTVNGMTDAANGKGHLYIHPQEISGSVLKNDVRKIAGCLLKRETFSLRWVDLYETVYDMSDEEYREYLSEKKEDIRKHILTSAVTKRRDLFHLRDEVAERGFGKVQRVRIGVTDEAGSFTDRIAFNYACSVIDELAEEGYLVKAEGRDGRELVRTINKTEQKKLKLYIDEDSGEAKRAG